VTHDPQVARHARRIVAMQDGRAVQELLVADRLHAAAAA